MVTREGILRGMTAGLIAAGVMSAVRLLAHRVGLIDRMVPQVLQERVAGEAGLELPGGEAGHQLAAEVIHHLVGLASGGLLGAVAHAVFGAVLAFAMRELTAQPRLQPMPTSVPVLRRVG